MRLFLLPLALAAALGGCAEKAYLFDHKISSKTAMMEQELARYGLSPDEARCVSERLGNNLSIWQMRQLNAAGAAVQADAAPLTVRDLLRVASQVRDAKVTLEVAGAAGACAVNAVSPPQIAEAKPVDPAPPEVNTAMPAAPQPSQAPEAGGSPTQSAGNAAVQNGPRDYQPSDELVAALAAYEKGDFGDAARLAKAAVELGDSGAQQLLGGLYSFGRGVPQDHVAAVGYYRLAAAQGWSEAMNNLGRAYETGQGVPRDAVEALKWYLLASTRTTEDNEMVRRNIQNVVHDMSTEQIEKAARQAQDWNQGRGR